MFAEQAINNDAGGSNSASVSELSSWYAFPDPDGDAFEDFPNCGTHAVVERRADEWLHGEVQFEETNLRSKYLIVPEGVGDASAVIAVMCSLWDLQVPELFLAFNGGQDTAAGMLSNVLDHDVWQGRGAGRQGAANGFGESLLKSCKGIATACSESKAWVFGFDGSYGCEDGDEMWGTCFNTGWSYFGQGRRSSLACQSVEFLCAKGLRGMYGERKFRNHAVQLSRSVETVMVYPSVSKRLQKDGKAVPDCVAEASGRANRPKRSQMIWPEFTHILLFDGDASKDPFPDIYETMRSITSTVHVVMGGVHPTLTNSVVEESETVPVVILNHSGGSADVIAKALEQRRVSGDAHVEARYTQSADDLLDGNPEWDSLKWSSMHPDTSSWSLPPSAQTSNFVIIDIRRDSIRNVVDKVFHAFSYTSDMETRQVGAIELEREHLQEAWRRVVTFKHNAARYGLASTALTYAIMALVLLIVILASLNVYANIERMLNRVYEQTGVGLGSGTPLPEWLADRLLSSWDFGVAVVVLPCLVGLCQTCLITFSPHAKQGQLFSASSFTKAEIYRYRMRMGEYARRPGHGFSIHKQIGRMPAVRRELLLKKSVQVGDTEALVSSAPGSPHSKNTAYPDEVKIDFSRLYSSREPLLQVAEDAAKRRPGRGARTRRSAFNAKLEQIQAELGNDVRVSSLADPPLEALGSEYASLVGAREEADAAQATALPAREDFEPRRKQEHVLGRSFDDGSSTLVAEDYIRFRLQPALGELSGGARRHLRVMVALEVSRYLATLACIIAAMLSELMLVPITITLVCLITNVMHFHNFSARHQSVNVALAELRNLLMWWESLDTSEQRMKHMMDYLVEATEVAMLADQMVVVRPPLKPSSDRDDAEGNEGPPEFENEVE